MKRCPTCGSGMLKRMSRIGGVDYCSILCAPLSKPDPHIFAKPGTQARHNQDYIDSWNLKQALMGRSTQL